MPESLTNESSETTSVIGFCPPLEGPADRTRRLIGRLEALIPGLEYSRETHVQWKNWLTKHPEDGKGGLGTPADHEKHIKLYDERIGTVRETVDYLKSMMTFTVAVDQPITLPASFGMVMIAEDGIPPESTSAEKLHLGAK